MELSLITGGLGGFGEVRDLVKYGGGVSVKGGGDLRGSCKDGVVWV